MLETTGLGGSLLTYANILLAGCLLAWMGLLVWSHCLSCRRHLRIEFGSLSREAQVRLTGGFQGYLASALMDVRRQSFPSSILPSQHDL